MSWAFDQADDIRELRAELDSLRAKNERLLAAIHNAATQIAVCADKLDDAPMSAHAHFREAAASLRMVCDKPLDSHFRFDVWEWLRGHDDLIAEIDSLRSRLAAYEQPDDGEAVTEEWLREIGVLMEQDDEDSIGMAYSPGRCAVNYFYVVQCCSAWQAVIADEEQNNEVYLGDVTTRRQVRRLIAAQKGEPC